METYLAIGFFIGLVMIGVYWGTPIAITGPKSIGRVLFIIITAPFLWPVQLAFYGAKIFFGHKK